MYFETGQGSALSADAHHGVDQQTLEARAYGVARAFDPLLVNTVVGFIGPEYLYDGKQIIRAGLEDHFCGKLLGLPMGCDVCYTNHAEADQDDMDALLDPARRRRLHLHHGRPRRRRRHAQLSEHSFHDALYLRRVLGQAPGAGVRSLARTDGDCRLRRPADRPRMSGQGAARRNPACRGAPMSEVPALCPGPSCAERPRHGSGSAAPAQHCRQSAHLDFQLAHARARDAVYAAFDAEAIATRVRECGLEPLCLRSAAGDRLPTCAAPILDGGSIPNRASA